ncbi:MAG: hypothetical protein HY824_08505 [Acidobacteria bacterium]|nr:hypothetical protein [Acidobacteriota bacterium]
MTTPAGGGTPLLDFFRHGNVDRDIRLMAAQGLLGLRAHEHAAMLEFLAQDPDPEVAAAAAEGLRLAVTVSADAPDEEAAPAELDEKDGTDEQDGTALQRIAAMSPARRLALAMRGTREERAILVRDPNRIVAVAVLSSPKVTQNEIESISKMANVSDEILRIIGHTRAWMKNYAIVSALAKNPKTPVGVSLTLLQRLLERDVKALAADRNIPEVLRLAARKRLTPGA